MTPDDARQLLGELDELIVRVRVQEARLAPDDPDIVGLKRDLQTARDRVIDYLAHAASAAAATIH
jgi:hypothetical protein